MAKQQIETEQVTIEIPKKLMDFLRAHFKDPIREYIQPSVIESMKADIDNQNVFTESILEKYNIDPTFKDLVELTETIDY
jgi:hypothetical protein